MGFPYRSVVSPSGLRPSVRFIRMELPFSTKSYLRKLPFCYFREQNVVCLVFWFFFFFSFSVNPFVFSSLIYLIPFFSRSNEAAFPCQLTSSFHLFFANKLIKFLGTEEKQASFLRAASLCLVRSCPFVCLSQCLPQEGETTHSVNKGN